MKVQIVNLDPDDDYGSIRDKLLWTQTQRALLVWPGRDAVLKSQLDLVLLKRLGIQRGIVIGLLTHDPQVQSFARELSIPLFEDLKHLPESKWAVWQTAPKASPERPLRRERPRPTRPTNPKQSIIIRIFVILLPLISFLIASVLVIPRAEIQLYPATLREIQTLTFTLADQSSVSKLELSYEILELEIQGEQRLPTSGQIRVPDQFAQGVVVFTNNTNEAFSIPAGTSVRAAKPDSPYFITDRIVQLEGTEGAQVTVSVTAAVAGPAGNLPAESINNIDGVLGLSLNVSNPAAFTGGSLQTRSAVNSRDVTLVEEVLKRELFAQLLMQTAASLPPQEYLLESSLEIVEIVSADYDAEVGDAADSLGLTLSLRAQVKVVDLERIQLLAASHLEADLLPGYVFVPGSPEVREISEQDQLERMNSHLDVDLALRSYRGVDFEALRSKLKGSSIPQAMVLLKGLYPSSPSPIISISPSWFPRMPWIGDQIQISLAWDKAP